MPFVSKSDAQLVSEDKFEVWPNRLASSELWDSEVLLNAAIFGLDWY